MSAPFLHLAIQGKGMHLIGDVSLPISAFLKRRVGMRDVHERKYLLALRR